MRPNTWVNHKVLAGCRLHTNCGPTCSPLNVRLACSVVSKPDSMYDECHDDGENTTYGE